MKRKQDQGPSVKKAKLTCEHTKNELKVFRKHKPTIINRKLLLTKIVQSKQLGLKQNGEKPNWPEVKKKSKDLKMERKSKRKQNLFDDIKRAKILWEELRSSKCSPELLKEITAKITKLLKGKFFKVVRSHDMSRIVQWLMKLGSHEVRKVVAYELIDDVVVMAKCKYAHHSVKAILKYGTTEIRKRVIEKFYGHVVKLLSSRFGLPLVEEVYSKYSSINEKVYLKQELYGDVFKHTKDKNISSLPSVFKDTPGLKDAILNSTKKTLMKLVEKRAADNCSLIHNVLYDYLCNCNDNCKEEFINLLHGQIKSLISTKDGSKIGRLFMWCANNKLKKKIVKDLRLEMKSVCMNEHGSMFLLALIDSVDDTILLKKCLLPCIISNALSIAHDEHGRKVLFYLVAHRNPSYFHPVDLEILRHGDESEFTKKDCAQRMKELMGDLIEPLLCNIQSNPASWFKNGKVGLVTLAILQAALPGKSLEETYDVIANLITEEASIIIEDGITYNIIEHSGIHLVLKKLLLHDKRNANQIGKSFSECLVTYLTEEVLARWISQNRGCFMLVLLIETNIPKVLSEIKEKFKSNKKLQALLEGENSKGSDILLNHLKAL